jgi:hypothetical protein
VWSGRQAGVATSADLDAGLLIGAQHVLRGMPVR